jgi:hypothetical protein
VKFRPRLQDGHQPCPNRAASPGATTDKRQVITVMMSIRKGDVQSGSGEEGLLKSGKGCRAEPFDLGSREKSENINSTENNLSAAQEQRKTWRAEEGRKAPGRG